MLKPTDWKAVRKRLQEFLTLESDFIERFKTARSRRAKLKKEITATVVRSEWFTDLYYELDPTFFILGFREGKPARQLKREPVSKIGMVRYSYDSENRLVHAEKCMAWDEYRTHESDRIDATRFHAFEKSCLDIQTLFSKNNQPTAHIESDNNWLRIKKYEYQHGKISRVFTANKRISATDGVWSFGKYEIHQKRYGIIDVHVELDSHKAGDICVIRQLAPIPKGVKNIANARKARKMHRD